MYQPGIGLPLQVIKEIKPIFVDLADEKLLKRCLDCKIQNQNECFNGYVWRQLPKDTYVGLQTFEFGLYDAVAVYNIGREATLRTFDHLKIPRGKYTISGCSQRNKTRLYFAEYKNKNSSKQSRKIIPGNKKAKTDKLLVKEGKTYGAGEF